MRSCRARDQRWVVLRGLATRHDDRIGGQRKRAGMGRHVSSEPRRELWVSGRDASVDHDQQPMPPRRLEPPHRSHEHLVFWLKNPVGEVHVHTERAPRSSPPDRVHRSSLLQVYTSQARAPAARSRLRRGKPRPAGPLTPQKRGLIDVARRVPGPSFPVRRVLSRLRSGSSSPIVVDTAGGRFVTKLRGAAQGPSALVAEVIVAELAEHLGLPVPERVSIELPIDVETDDANDELADLLAASVGQNLGFRWIDGASVWPAAEVGRIDDEFAVRVLWLDALVMNPDRTAYNPNVLLGPGAALAHRSWRGADVSVRLGAGE